MANTIKFRRGLNAARTFTPAAGEPVWATDTKALFVGDGSTVGGVAVSPVTSVFGRVGAVVATTGDYTTAQVTESGSLYFTEPRVRSTVLTGFAANNATITATDSVLAAFGKTQGQLDNKQGLNSVLTSITGQSSGTGLLKLTNGVASLDSSVYLTANQTITLSGDVTGSGTTAVSTAISAATVTGKLLTGYTVGANTAIAATDTILAAFGKAQGQIANRLTLDSAQSITGLKTHETYPNFGLYPNKVWNGLSCFSDGAKAAKTWRKLFTMPVTSASNKGIVTLKGLVSGYTFAQGKAEVCVVFNSRDVIRPSSTIVGTLGICDIEMYRESDNSFTVYAVANIGSIHPWNLTLSGDFANSAAAATYSYDSSVETTATPSGTIEWSLSTGYSTLTTTNTINSTVFVVNNDAVTGSSTAAFKAGNITRTAITAATDGLFKIRSYDATGAEIDQPLTVDNNANGDITVGNINRSVKLSNYIKTHNNMDPGTWDVATKTIIGTNIGWNREPGKQKTTFYNRVASGTNGGYSFRWYEATTPIDRNLLDIDYAGNATFYGNVYADNLVTLDTTQTITGSKTFTGTVNARSGVRGGSSTSVAYASYWVCLGTLDVTFQYGVAVANIFFSSAGNSSVANQHGYSGQLYVQIKQQTAMAGNTLNVCEVIASNFTGLSTSRIKVVKTADTDTLKQVTIYIQTDNTQYDNIAWSLGWCQGYTNSYQGTMVTPIADPNPSALPEYTPTTKSAYFGGSTVVPSGSGYAITGGSSSQFLKADGSVDTSAYITQAAFNASNQDLAAIEAITGSYGFLRKTSVNTWEVVPQFLVSVDSNSNNGIGRLYTYGAGTFNTIYGSSNGNINGGSNNTILGALNTTVTLTGSHNTVVGYSNGSYITSGSGNTLIGIGCGNALTTGDYNVLIGMQAGANIGTSSYDNIIIGNGKQLSGVVNNRLVIDPYQRGTRTSDITDALIYGVANATPASQTLNLNAAVNARYGLQLNGVNVVTESTKTREIVIQMEGISNSAPSVVNFVDANNSCLAFNGNATTNNLYGSIDMQHDYVAGTGLDIHLHWAPTTATGGNVKWQLYYNWTESGGTWAAATLATVTTAAGTTAWADKLSTWTISGTGKTYNSRLKLRLFRNPSDAADTYPDNAAYVQLSAHYSANLGQA